MLYAGVILNDLRCDPKRSHAGVILNDLMAFDTVNLIWQNLSTAQAPVPRYAHGFIAAGGRLYLLGGVDTHGS